MLMLLSTTFLNPLKADNKDQTKILWNAKGCYALATHKLGLLIAKSEDKNKISEIDFVDYSTGKSLWNNKDNDITKEYSTNTVNFYSIKIYKNTVIFIELKKSICFDLLKGKKMWTVSDIDLYNPLGNQAGPVVYTTYTKEYKTNVIDLIEFDLDYGLIKEKKEINLASDDIAFGYNGCDPTVIGVKDDKILFDFCYQIQCYDLIKQRVIWKTKEFYYTGECKIIDTNIIVSRNNQIDCETDSYYYDFHNLFTGQLQNRLNAVDLYIKDNNLFFYQFGCSINEKLEKYIFFKKRLYGFETMENMSFPNMDYAYTRYGTNYCAIATYKDNKRRNGIKIDIYDYDFNHIQAITKPSDLLDKLFSIKVFDDVMVLNISPTNDSNNSEVAVYALPDYKQSNHTYKLPINFIQKVLQFILKKIRMLP